MTIFPKSISRPLGAFPGPRDHVGSLRHVRMCGLGARAPSGEPRWVQRRGGKSDIFHHQHFFVIFVIFQATIARRPGIRWRRDPGQNLGLDSTKRWTQSFFLIRGLSGAPCSLEGFSVERAQKKVVFLAVQFDFEGKFEPLDERFSPSRGLERFGRGRKWGTGHLSGQTGFWSARGRTKAKTEHLAHEKRPKTGNETKNFENPKKKIGFDVR